MDLKERSSQVAREQVNVMKVGAERSINWVTEWVKEPGNTKESGTRFLMAVGGGLGMWIVAVRESPVVILLATPVVLAMVFFFFGWKKEAEKLVEGPVEEGQTQSGVPESSPREGSPQQAPQEGEEDPEFWTKHTPRETRPVRLSKPSDVTLRDAEMLDTQPVQHPLESEETAIGSEKPQVSGVEGSWTPCWTPDTTNEDTVKIRNVDHVGIFTVTNEVSNTAPHEENPQFSGVSNDLDTPSEPDISGITKSDESQVPDLGDEPPPKYLETILKMHRNGSSVREISLVTSVPKSTIHHWLKKSASHQDTEEIRELARASERVPSSELSTPSEPGARPLPRVVLPGGWFGEDGHVQDVRFVDRAVRVSEDSSYRDNPEDILSFIRNAFLGKTDTTTDNWQVDLSSGTISGSLPDRNTTFSGFWSETGTVVIAGVMIH